MIDLKTAPYAALLLRVVTGALFTAHGLIKFFVFTPAGTIGYFQSIGLPGWLGIVTMLLEIFGGLALVLGVRTREFSVAFVAILIGAAVSGHGGNGFNWSNPNGGWEYPVMWATVMLVLAALGDGPFAILPSKRLK